MADNKSKKLKEYKELEKELAKHKELYENGEPIITDSEYDALYFKLQELMEELGIEDEDSEFAKITAPTTKSTLAKVKHSSFVGSLGKTTTKEGITSFYNDVIKTLREARRLAPAGKFGAKDYANCIVLEPKCDGLTIVATYKDGYLLQALTRGDGEVGEDVTENVRNIKNIPVAVRYTGTFKIRFEAMIGNEDFEAINIDGNYSNSRNLVAGTIRHSDSSLIKKRNVIGIVFDLLEGDSWLQRNVMGGIDKQNEWLRSQNFDVVPMDFVNVDCSGPEVLYDRCIEFGKTKRNELPYKTDGYVLKVNNLELQNNMGYRFHNPRWALAFKFESLDASTILKNVEFTVGRTGRITPVAVFDPVTIDNVVITKATLHNEAYVKSKDLHIGDKIIVARSNDVIPAVTANVQKNGGKAVEYPKVCPCCGTKLVKDGEMHVCPNKDCEEQVVQKIISWCAKHSANIVGLSEKRIRQLYEAGYVKKVANIYDIPSKWEELADLPTWGFTLLEGLISSIEDSKKIRFANFIRGLGINGVGDYTAKVLSKKYHSINKFMAADYSELCSLNGIGDEIATEICTFISENSEDIIELSDKLDIEYEKELGISGLNLEGKSFVITGTLSRTRDYYVEEIEKAGGKVTGSVSKKTDYVIQGTDPGKTKMDAAKKLGIRILDESDLLEAIEGIRKL